MKSLGMTELVTGFTYLRETLTCMHSLLRVCFYGHIVLPEEKYRTALFV